MWFFSCDRNKISQYINHRNLHGRKILKIRKKDKSTGLVINEYTKQETIKNGYKMKQIYMCADGILKTTQGFAWEVIYGR